MSSVPVYAGLKRRNILSYIPVVAVALIVCVIVYSVTGIFGYLTFYAKVCISSDILRNYPPQDPAVDVARVMLILVMITSYPILAFCGRYIYNTILHNVYFTSFYNNIEQLWIIEYSNYYNESFHIPIRSVDGGRDYD